MKTCLIIQPGAFGDLFVCAPIAKHYHDQGYNVVWPCAPRFANVMSHFDYVSYPILSNRFFNPDWLKSDVIQCLSWRGRHNPDLVINLADRGPHPTAQLSTETFEQTKYRLAGVSFKEKHNLVWKRDIKKENEIYDKVVGDEKDYIFAHLSSSNNDRTEIPIKTDKKIVEMTPIEGDDIVGWYKVIMNASQVFCVESSVHCFIDGFIHQLPCPKFLLSRSTLRDGLRYTVSEFWDKQYMR